MASEITQSSFQPIFLGGNMTEVKYAELHSPFFVGGKSFGTKLDPKTTQGLSLFYDKPEKELVVYWKNHLGTFVANLPSSNVVSYQPIIEGVESKVVEQHKAHPMKKGIQSAQVQTPMDHVFQGEGAGKTKQ